MSCDDIRAALSEFDACEETSNGSRVMTHCLYPSFEPVSVFVVKLGDGFKIHDGGGAFVSAWSHGRDQTIINRALQNACSRFHLSMDDERLVAEVSSKDWLLNAILGVANASSQAANAAVSRIVAVAEAALFDRIREQLVQVVGANGFNSDVELTGKSGGRRHFDFAIKINDEAQAILINGVSPHHGSVSAKYVAFADTDGDQDHKLAVYDRQLDTDDIALLQQVASILPIASLFQNAKRVMAH